MNNNFDIPVMSKPHPDAERCRCDCHRPDLGRSYHVMPCCFGGWKMPLGYLTRDGDGKPVLRPLRGAEVHK